MKIYSYKNDKYNIYDANEITPNPILKKYEMDNIKGNNLILNTIKSRCKITPIGNTIKDSENNTLKIVTGKNNIIISDGKTNSQNYYFDFQDLTFGIINNFIEFIYGEPNKWYKKNYIKRVILDGTQSVSRVQTSTSGEYRFYITVNPAPISGTTTNKPGILCSKLNEVTRNDTFASIEGISYTGTAEGSTICVFIEETKEMTTTEFKTWLGENNLIVDYLINNPKDFIIEDTSLIENLNSMYNNAITYDGKTYITVTNEEENAPLNLDVEVLVERV